MTSSIFRGAQPWDRLFIIQLCPKLCDPMSCGQPGSSVHGIPQTRILERGAVSFSRGYSRPRDQTLGLLHCRQILYHLSHQGSALIGTLGTSILSLSVTLAQETAKLKNKNSKPKFFRCWHSCKLANRSLLVSVFSFDQRNLLLIWQMNQTFN